ncbi:hypothetical protein RHMOL_Rhmol05G0136000 [Rhododendron molle]|uniref:Uncharacterized protein n=1 Tax=Rhododendron molle TaxID=49168 RepID=A0ACC0NQX2_RHOML|nr:hypothetical protein RHMOL_Rhmol05G0136000 [Rhododendron molle]
MAFPWQDLPGEIEFDILSRLPPKSLLRSRCVCKNWLSLFSNPSFIHKHLLHRNCTSDDDTLLIHNCAHDSLRLHHGLSLLNLENPKNPLTFNLNHPFPQKNNQCDMDLVGSINGLVCLTSKTDGLVSILWNPATKDCVNIPTPNLKFLPNQGGSSIGFCFDSLRNDYKILNVVWFNEDMELRPRPRVELYSVSTDCWREIEIEVETPFEYLSTRCDTIVNGEPYWSAYFYGDPFVNVVWFDVDKEVFREGPQFLPEPFVFLQEPFVECLVNFENSVAVLASAVWPPEGKWEDKISLWVMEDDSSSWSMKFSAGPSSFMTLVGCSKKGEILFRLFGEHVLQLYNPKTQETCNIETDLEGLRIEFEKFRFQVSNYTTSLVPIRGFKQAEKEGTGGKRRKIEHQVA